MDSETDFLEGVSLYEEIVANLHYDVRDQFDISTFVGYGQLAGDNSVEIVTGDHEGTVITGEKILLETGGSPKKPDIDFENVGVFDNRTIQHADPDDIIVVGSSVEAIEWSIILHERGTDVTLLCKTDRPLSSLPDSLASVGAEHLDSLGIDRHTDVTISETYVKDGRVVVDCEGSTHTSGSIMDLSERTPHTGKLQLQHTDVETTESRHIDVDRNYRTTSSSILSIGYVSNSPILTDVATAQEGRLAVRNAIAETDATANYDAIPHVVYTDPKLFFTGEPDRLGIGDGSVSHRVEFDEVPRANSDGEREGAITVAADDRTGELRRVFGYGPGAAAIVSEAALAIRRELTVTEIAETVHLFPATTEVLRQACEELSM